MFDKFDMTEKEKEALRFNLGLARILSITLGIFDYDWDWFKVQIAKNKTVITEEKDMKNMNDMVDAIKKLQPMVQYFNERGGQIRDLQEKSTYN